MNGDIDTAGLGDRRNARVIGGAIGLTAAALGTVGIAEEVVAELTGLPVSPSSLAKATIRKATTGGGVKLLTHEFKKRIFKGDEAIKHFTKHASELMKAFGKKNYNLKDYVNDANNVIKNGTFVPEMNGYVKLVGGQGSAKYGFTGLDRASGQITTFHLKSVSELAKKAPSLGFTK